MADIPHNLASDQNVSLLCQGTDSQSSARQIFLCCSLQIIDQICASLKTCLHSLSSCHKSAYAPRRWNESLTPTRSRQIPLPLVCNLCKPARSQPPPLAECGRKINRSAYFLHIIIIALQDKHLIPALQRSEQIIRGLVLSAPK